MHPKNPDLKINNEYYEVEKTNDFNNIANRISVACKQANNVILIYDNDLDTELKKLSSTMFRVHPNLKTIEVRANNKKLFYKRL